VTDDQKLELNWRDCCGSHPDPPIPHRCPCWCHKETRQPGEPSYRELKAIIVELVETAASLNVMDKAEELCKRFKGK
jgi:hypothetical protein